jgi:hypothetical protein
MKQQINEFKRMQQLAGLITEAKAEVYSYEATPEKQALYDKIATELEKLIKDIASKLKIKPSNIRISCDGLWDKESYKNRGLVVQIKSSKNTWNKPWIGNNIIVQTPNNEGIIIHPGLSGKGVVDLDLDIDNTYNKELETIYKKAREQNLGKYVSDFNVQLANSLTPQEIKLIAPNTPIVITGK